MDNYTPESIAFIYQHQVFVFGSNMNGAHIGGAARIAYDQYGAIWGYAEGRYGHSYAIPTLDKDFNKVTEEQLEDSIDTFLEHVMNHKGTDFLLTKIGCGIAGWEVEDVKRIFWQAAQRTTTTFTHSSSLPTNLKIPKEFDNI